MRRLTLLASYSIGLLLCGPPLPALAAPFAYITNSGSASVSVIDIATNKTVATIPTQAGPYGVAINADGSRVYVGNNSAASVTVIDARLNSAIANIPVGIYPNQIALKPDGTRLYVANYLNGKMTVIDTVSNSVLANVALGVNPIGIAVNPAGTRVYVSSPNFGTVQAIDTATNNYVGSPIAVPSASFLAVSPDGARLYVVGQDSNNLTVINTATNAVAATVPVGVKPLGLSLSPDGSRVYVANRTDNSVTVVDAASNAVVGTIGAGAAPLGSDSNPAGSRLYVANSGGNTVSVINTANNTQIAAIPVGAGPAAMGHFIGPAPVPATTARLSKSSSGAQGRDDSTQGAVSADGRYVVFVSEAANLASGDTNGVSDVFLRDRLTKQTKRVSLGTGGIQANGASYSPVISADGRVVAFASDADNLVAGDTNQSTDVFVRDLSTGVTARVSVDSASPAVQGNGDSYEPALNADGSKVAFTSAASNLVTGDTNNFADVFLRDRVANATSRVSVVSGAAGAQGNGESGQAYLSASGQIVAFVSQAGNLVGGDTNGVFDVFVRDRAANTTSRVSLGPAGGTQANKDSWQPALSGDGRYVVFASDASNLVAGDTNGVADVFLRDRIAGATSRVSVDALGGQADDGPSYDPVVSNDGRYVAFDSLASLDPADYNNAWDVYLRDRVAATTVRLSVATNTQEGNADSQRPAMSADGRYVLFESSASNLEAGDTNNAWDVFVRDRGIGSAPGYPLLAVPGK